MHRKVQILIDDNVKTLQIIEGDRIRMWPINSYKIHN
jgi:5'(3')-deoxyribonucleotidase